jgi:YD repeat-containing protein
LPHTPSLTAHAGLRHPGQPHLDQLARQHLQPRPRQHHPDRRRAVSRTKTLTDGNGQTHTLTYDALDRVTRVEASDGTWFTFAYDGNGNLVERKDGDGALTSNTTTYAYDELNRRTSETVPADLGTLQLDGKTSYTYDANSNLASVSDAGGTVSYTYGQINRVKTITDRAPPQARRRRPRPTPTTEAGWL